MTAGRFTALCVAVLLMPAAREAVAQPRVQPGPRDSRVHVSIGAALGGPAALGTAAADFTRPSGASLSEFRTNSRFGAGLGGEVSVTGLVSRRVGLEATASWLRQQVRTAITDDFERAADLTLTQPIYRVLVEGAAVVGLTRGTRTDLYLRAGGGWMQELADGATLAETGTTASVGVGVKYWWRDRPPGRGTRMGLRIDGRMLARSGGIAFGSGTWQFGPTGTAGVVFGF